ncbi:MAG: DNA-directed RNA polymerase subunit omega [Acidobacteriota bacterium]
MEQKTLAQCLSRVPNRFELVSLGWKRSHQLIEGSAPFIPRQGDKAEAHALREIAAGAFSREEDADVWKPTMEAIFEPAPPQEEEVPRDEDRDDDLAEGE